MTGMKEGSKTELIRMEGVCVAAGDRSILSGFDMSVAKEEKVLVKGRSGIGKTTLFRLLLGFRVPSSGTLYFEGRPMDAGLAWDIRKRVAHISQDSDIGEGVVRDMLEEIFSYNANKGHFDSGKLRSLLAELSLQEDVLDKKFENLSGGEKQRIAIIISLLTKKDIFLLDEITSDLDAKLKRKVVDMFVGNPSWTVLAISHDSEWEREGVRVIDLEKLQEGAGVCD
jgi:putative ABC transport system ATP-binding protein